MTNAAPTTGGIERRHDFDALRAFAMALGIVLHGAVAFIPGVWVVTDASVEGDGTLFALLTTAIHGFRMPLFFLLSGFFTAMLWRQRGLRALLHQRAQRILLPLAIAMVTVIPLTWVAWDYAASASPSDASGSAGGEQAAPEVRAEDSIWAAAALGDIAALEAHAARGAPIDTPDPLFGVTPLSWAALHGRTGAAAWLLDAGADVGAPNRDGNTPLHAAAFMGRTKVAQLLLERGADVHAQEANGGRSIDSARVDAASTAALAELLGVSYDEAALEERRKEIVRLLTAAEQADVARDAGAERTDAAGGVAPYRDGADADVGGDEGLLAPWYWSVLYSEEWGALFTEDVFSHLWFLWYLVWLVGAFALIVWAAGRLGARLPRLPERLVVTPALYLWAVPLTMAAQYLMGVEGQYPEFGADTYTGLLPVPHVLAYYGIFFAFGVVYFNRDDGGARIGRGWQLTLPLAMLVFLEGAALTFPDGGGAAQGWARAGSLFCQAAYAWMMTLGLMGLFRAALGQGDARVRYLSDASYWLYLMHLPLIIALQGAAQGWPLPSALKLALLVAATSGVLLLVYEWGVRYTPLGALLNGRRVRVRRIEGG